MVTELLFYLGLILFCGGLFTCTYVLGISPATERPTLGTRGMRRRMALESSGGFKLIEPVMRFMGGWFHKLPAPKLRSDVETKITLAGDYLGLNSNDFFGLSTLTAIAFGCVAGLISTMIAMPPIMSVAFVLLGASIPWMQIDGVAQERFKAVTRSLPTSIDLAALCMSAGLDFPGAMRQIIDKSSSRDAILKEEFQRIVAELELGHTRSKALTGFAERVPVESVLDFVAAVQQAEQKGTPLAEVLSIQATTLRNSRTVRAEEMATKAGLMMMGPMMLMFVCIILLLLGPMVLKFMGSGF